MLSLGEPDFATSSHDSFDANRLVMVTLRQATRFIRKAVCLIALNTLRAEIVAWQERTDEKA
jgi:hypothetical protein